MRRLTPGRVWVTRTQPEADATAERVRALGWTPVVAPVLEYRALPGATVDLTGAGALAFTSSAGVRAFADLTADRTQTVFAVGEATARAARVAGFTQVHAGRGDVQALAEAIAAARPGLVVNPTAREPAADLAALLTARGIPACSQAVYETAPTLAAAPIGIDAILVHSPRAARLLTGLIAPSSAPSLTVFAISEAAAAPLRALPFGGVSVAPNPSEAALLDLLRG